MNYTCPSCGKLLDAQRGISFQLPEPPVGSNMICFYCENILIVGPEKLTIATDEYLESLNSPARLELAGGIALIKSLKKRMF